MIKALEQFIFLGRKVLIVLDACGILSGRRRFSFLNPNKRHANALWPNAVKRHEIFLITAVRIAIFSMLYQTVHAAPPTVEPIEACVFVEKSALNEIIRAKYAQCLYWQEAQRDSLCRGHYQPIIVAPLPNDEIRITADEVSLYSKGRSELKGQVEIRETQRIVNAQTAHLYRDAKTNQVIRIELFDQVRYREPGRLMIARKATIHPQDKSGRIEAALYRFNAERRGHSIPAWGMAGLIERFPNQDYVMKDATYTTCPPKDHAWQIEADQIKLDHAAGKGVARNATLRVHDWPVLYTPYLSFPTTHQRKSGFLMPQYGYTNIGGFDLGLPYYWNIAPNQDATIMPHYYTRRGMMLGGDYRFLTPNSTGIASGHFLPQDRAFAQFLQTHREAYPRLQNLSDNRWSLMLHEATQFNPNLRLHINFQQVSDDYYLQDFSTNLATLTQNQLLRQGDLTYATEHWSFHGMLQSYQTLHPINQSAVSDIYERLPQFRVRGSSLELPMNTQFDVIGQLDEFHWPVENPWKAQGPRFHLNPKFSMPWVKPWGYLTPELQVVENYYDLHYDGQSQNRTFNRTIPRYALDGGLFFERLTRFMGRQFTQTLEPKLDYLYVPYHDQTPIQVFDSAYMIFNYDQLFRANRFSGFDRIGDTNQLAYAFTTRWLSEETGQEKASFSLGQIRYFSDRRVQLCHRLEGNCVDNPHTLGYLPPTARYSPIASRLVYQLHPFWMVSGDYIWDVDNKTTNNADLNFHYQPAANQLVNFGYSYLVNGDSTLMAGGGIENNALHQVSLAYAWPLNDHWSNLGAYRYNISKQYNMMAFLGLQYESCCWAFRLLGGRTFRSLTPGSFIPQYTNNVYLQVLLKGLGSAASSDPSSVIGSYFPGYADIFH